MQGGLPTGFLAIALDKAAPAAMKAASQSEGGLAPLFTLPAKTPDTETLLNKYTYHGITLDADQTLADLKSEGIAEKGIRVYTQQEMAAIYMHEDSQKFSQRSVRRTAIPHPKLMLEFLKNVENEYNKVHDEITHDIDNFINTKSPKLLEGFNGTITFDSSGKATYPGSGGSGGGAANPANASELDAATVTKDLGLPLKGDELESLIFNLRQLRDGKWTADSVYVVSKWLGFTNLGQYVDYSSSDAALATMYDISMASSSGMLSGELPYIRDLKDAIEVMDKAHADYIYSLCIPFKGSSTGGYEVDTAEPAVPLHPGYTSVHGNAHCDELDRAVANLALLWPMVPGSTQNELNKEFTDLSLYDKNPNNHRSMDSLSAKSDAGANIYLFQQDDFMGSKLSSSPSTPYEEAIHNYVKNRGFAFNVCLNTALGRPAASATTVDPFKDPLKYIGNSFRVLDPFCIVGRDTPDHAPLPSPVDLLCFRPFRQYTMGGCPPPLSLLAAVLLSVPPPSSSGCYAHHVFALGGMAGTGILCKKGNELGNTSVPPPITYLFSSSL